MNNLREFRVKKLMTQKELSEESGVSQVTISFAENSLTIPMDITKQKLAKALKCSSKDLFPPSDKIVVKRLKNLKF